MPDSPMPDIVVMTVRGPLPVEDMGTTLMHEHIRLDASSWWHCPSCAERMRLAERKLEIDMLGELRMDPFLNKDNCMLDDAGLAVAELAQFKDLGGATVVDPTNVGIGRDPLVLERISTATGLNIVMGAGFYLEASHPPRVQSMSPEAIAEEIAREAAQGVDDTGIRIGIIGEIGISADFTPAEEKVLRGAALAAASTQLPLSVHLPGWERHAHRVLDVAERAGCNPHSVVLCHMNPSFFDGSYQRELAERGAFIEYDMIGMDYFYADQQAQCPYDENNAAAIKGLIDDGYIEQVLLSQDVFLKMMLTCYGGFGYAYILRHFVPRLHRHGVTEEQIVTLLEANPRRVFSNPQAL
ncbi:MAG: phosphotriesterase family protein [Gammaproteobacteria bacterium]